jgi:PPOX class probable FMN-dependent enzyme
MSADPDDPAIVDTEQRLRAIVRAPSGMVVDKELDHIDAFARAFIEHSPFFVMATSGEHGRVDATPRGDPAGFVKVLDERHMLIPERKGNNRVDSMRNIVVNPHVGTIFFIPGRTDTLRVNGRATITSNQQLLAPLAIRDKTPKLSIIVETEEVFFQCAAALNRSKLWEHEAWPDPSVVASLGTAIVEQAKLDDVSARELDEGLEEWNSNPY